MADRPAAGQLTSFPVMIPTFLQLGLHGGLRVKNIHLFQVVLQVFPFIGAQDAEGEAYEGPQMDYPVFGAEVFAQFMDLCVAVVAGGDAIVRLGGLDLVVLELPVLEPLILEPGLEEAATPATAVVVGAVGLHVDEVFLAHHRFDHEAKVLGNGIAVAFAYDLAGVLDSEFDLEVLVPVGTDLELPFTDPLGVVFVNAFNLEVVIDTEFFQSGPD